MRDSRRWSWNWLGEFKSMCRARNECASVPPALRWFRPRFAWRAQALAERTVKDLQIATPDVDKPVQSLSGGNQQRVLIGRWLAIDPRVLILHGPTVGVDVGSKDIIYRIMQRLSKEGIGIILISDDLRAGRLVREPKNAASTTPSVSLRSAMICPAPP